MDAKTQKEIAERLKRGFESAGVEIEEPYSESGQLRFREPDWMVFAFRLAQSGYRLRVRKEEA